MLGLALIMEQSALRHLRLRNYSARMRGEGGGTGWKNNVLVRYMGCYEDKGASNYNIINGGL
jgi:hypothetical protein